MSREGSFEYRWYFEYEFIGLWDRVVPEKHRDMKKPTAVCGRGFFVLRPGLPN